MVNPPIVAITLRTFLLLAGMPQGIYGISYDISTPQTERDLPHGWNACRGSSHAVWNAGSSPGYRGATGCEKTWMQITTYYTMLMLGDITPPGKLSSMVKGLKMHMIHHWLLDVTQDIQLGGQYATMLVGPTPSRARTQMLHWMWPIGEYEVWQKISASHTRLRDGMGLASQLCYMVAQHEGIYEVKPRQEGE
ncbi:hypothetical protein EV401DRAFT_1892713 [Pisolithus croceorrhizus]|nr:hypothetical protein EV401DRAFT_1892713 [Pisolithus croceorrhizus]